MTLTVQFYTMFAMAGMGAWLGAALDTYRRFLVRSKRAGWIVFFHDLVFWLLQSVLFFYVLLLVNEGELRIYMFLAILLGFAAYQSMLKGIYLAVLNFMIHSVMLILKILGRIGQIFLIKPVRGILSLIVMIAAGLLNVFLKILKWAFLLTWGAVKIVLAPVRWILLLIWKMQPRFLKKFFSGIFLKSEGIMKKAKNLMISAWKTIKRITGK
ncbi:spore cortex biosynthesis protein YabQ [Bacillus sp. FJAT-42376]|uniref:spore cortex biosynthesis protein YabQ n=1 Tax=Bacillus sp. FJAT-42376 TaxID=2014076 RepID=UPI000F514099|nr:spore cortex biosynthesis protein YabQ [Bacillus sp. FJAT-42376]AZB41200.1 spore cortex biosynthesis protein YabQ [Bacillus sp. FJAT-42376]